MVHIQDLDKSTALKLVGSETPAEIRGRLNEPYSVDRKMVASYQKNGFIRAERVLTDALLVHIRKVIGAAVFLRKESDQRLMAEKSQYEQSFLQCGYLCWDYPAVRDIVFSKRLAGIARDLMDVDGVRLWHDQALFKEPGGRITDMHQDISYWPMKTDNTTTIWIALEDVPVERGCLYFLPETHRIGLYEYVDIFKNPHIPEKVRSMQKIDVPLRAGDATFHSGLTFHGANSNMTDRMREAMTIIYMEDGTKFDASDPRNATHKSCEGLKDGELIATRYTPVLI
jgi:ectoine hydroxylase-related dioxygenase (phytanoyl-CoA dioxygenase family)